MAFQSNRLWILVLPFGIGLMAISFASDFTAPWSGLHDFNSAVWAQAAANYSRAGLWVGAGMPSIFYFGALPIPPEAFYTHHPLMLPWLAYCITTILGPHEWALRLIPITCSFLSLLLLWRIVSHTSTLRTAALTCFAFVTLPMELAFGRMVNFEPLTLVLLLAATDRLIAWQANGRKNFSWAATIWLILTVQSSWMGHILVIPAALVLAFHKDTQLQHIGRWIMSTTLVAGIAFLILSSLANPGAMADLGDAFTNRLSINDEIELTWGKWIARVGPSLLTSFGPIWLLLAGGGVAISLRRPSSPQSRLLHSGGLIVLATTMLYLVVFRNASYVHAYSGFYLILPVALFAGHCLDSLMTQVPQRQTWVIPLLCVLLGGYQTIWSQQTSKAIQEPFVLLDGRASQADNLVVQLGQVINTHFDSDRTILTNMMPFYGPQLAYYAERQIVNCVTKTAEWDMYATDLKGAGGILWADGNNGPALLTNLDNAELTSLVIDGQTYYLWRTTIGMP